MPLLYAMKIPVALADARVCTEQPDSEPIRVMVTGDLSDSGLVGELVVAHTWLRAHLRLRLSEPLATAGLDRDGDDAILTIPGNHDHWRGRRWFGGAAYSPQAVADHFSVTPWQHSWRTAGLRVSVFGLDSASGMAGLSATNRLANGRISDAEFTSLEALLVADQAEAPGVPVVRCVLCHHSLVYRDPIAGHWNELASESRDRLQRLAVTYGVRVVLTGHTHDFFYPTDTTSIPVELRSSSLTGNPTSLVEPMDRRPGFWLHRVRSDRGRLAWDAWRYGWNGHKFARLRWTPCVTVPLS